MATLSIANQAHLQDAIDLMVKGSAREMPVAEDVIQRLVPVVVSLGLATSGGVGEVVRDNPFSVLIALVAQCGDTSLSASQRNALTDAFMLMVLGSAYETPFAEDVIARLAPVAESSGFASMGKFREDILLNPVSTMLRWALAVGSV